MIRCPPSRNVFCGGPSPSASWRRSSATGSRGVHPAQLAVGGLRPSLRALARRSPIPVDVSVDVPERPPASVETALYYVVSEALANAIKHSRATSVSVTVVGDSRSVRAIVADDGVGGAEPG